MPLQVESAAAACCCYFWAECESVTPPAPFLALMTNSVGRGSGCWGTTGGEGRLATRTPRPDQASWMMNARTYTPTLHPPPLFPSIGKGYLLESEREKAQGGASTGCIHAEEEEGGIMGASAWMGDLEERSRRWATPLFSASTGRERGQMAWFGCVASFSLCSSLGAVHPRRERERGEKRALLCRG